MLIIGEFKLTTTTKTTKNVDYFLKEEGYYKIENYYIFVKDYKYAIGDEFNPISIAFDFETNHFTIESAERENNKWKEYVMLSCSFDNNLDILSYIKEKDNKSIDRKYVYQPKISNEIELIESNFERDFFANTSEEKYFLFDECYDIFEQQLISLDLTLDDLLKWSESLK
jgi:hypothetical protein